MLILTAEVGEGHAAAARALAAEIEERDPEAEPVMADALEGLGPVLRLVLLDLYRWQLHALPAAFALLYALFARVRPLRWCGRRLLALLGGRSLRRLVELHRPDIVVSTYPAATAVLGELRRRDAIDVPLFATVTDLAGESFWAHPAVDRHLVMHEASVRPVERVGGRDSARVVRPLVHPLFHAPLTRAEARARLGIDEDAVLALVSGGGWGVGDLIGATRGILDVEGARAICLAGRDVSRKRELEEAFAGEPRVTVLGFTDRMSELLAAADAIVHSTGGVTCLEAFVRGCPVIAYGEPAGHAPLVGRRMASLGLVERVGDRAELTAAFRGVCEGARTPVELGDAPPASTVVLSAQRRERLGPERRPLRVRATLAAACVVVLSGWLATSSNAYALLAPWLGIEPVTSVDVSSPSVALVVRAGPGEVPAVVRELVRGHGRASIAVVGASPPAKAAVARSRDSIVPVLPAELGEPFGWVEQLGAPARSHPRYALEPTKGLSLSEYISAWEAGWSPIKGRSASATLRSGTIAVVSVSGDPSAAARQVGAFLARARRAHLRVIGLPESLVATSR